VFRSATQPLHGGVICFPSLTVTRRTVSLAAMPHADARVIGSALVRLPCPQSTPSCNLLHFLCHFLRSCCDGICCDGAVFGCYVAGAALAHSHGTDSISEVLSEALSSLSIAQCFQQRACIIQLGL
jgi:hypothetical protein